MKRAAFFVLFLSVRFALFSQNMVVNQGFETWEKINKPAGWTTSQNCLKDSANIKTGSYSCKHSGGTSTKYLGQIITVVPGNQYRLSFFYKTEITGSGNGCRIWCYWKDNAGNNISDLLTDNILRPSKYLKNDTWQEFSVEFAAPVNAASFYLEVRTYQNSISYFDEFIFEESVPTFNPEEEVAEVKIYPNPAHDYLIISNIQYLQHIDIQGLTGKRVWSSDNSGESSVTIPVTQFPNGIYIISIRTSGMLITRKLIKKSN